MLLPPVGYLRPDSIAEASGALADDPDAVVLAGGQTLTNVLKLRLARPSALVDVSRLEELRGIESDAQGVRIGASVTYGEIAASESVRTASPMVASVASRLVDRQVRARGTIGGNVCLNDPGSNYPPLVLALGATMHVYGPGGVRDVPAEEFFIAPYATDLGPGELLTGITIPAQSDSEGVGYASLQIGKDSWALARSSVWLRSDGRVDDVRVVVGCALPSPVRQRGAEDVLRGASLDPGLGAAASELAGDGLETMSDVHASGAYRMDMLRAMVGRAVRQAIEDRQRG